LCDTFGVILFCVILFGATLFLKIPTLFVGGDQSFRGQHHGVVGQFDAETNERAFCHGIAGQFLVSSVFFIDQQCCPVYI
jgi:hypothetical protein